MSKISKEIVDEVNNIKISETVALIIGITALAASLLVILTLCLRCVNKLRRARFYQREGSPPKREKCYVCRKDVAKMSETRLVDYFL